MIGDIKAITKGYFKLCETQETTLSDDEQSIEFVFGNSKITLIGAKI